MDQSNNPHPIPPPTLPEAPRSSGEEPSGWRDFMSTVGIIGTAFLVALFMIAFIFRSYQVDGPSMQTTLENQDKLIIWKVPRSIAKITGNAYIPDRGDVVVFTESGLGQYGREDSKQLIKRVIGIPGDRIVLSDGKYTVFNDENPNGFNPDTTLGYAYPGFPQTSGDVDVTLREEQLFVSGDNRPDSLDSRAFGPIDADQVIGKLVLRLFPIDQARVF